MDGRLWTETSYHVSMISDIRFRGLELPDAVRFYDIAICSDFANARASISEGLSAAHLQLFAGPALVSVD